MQNPAADALIAQKVRAGDPDGHAALFDTHAAGLYEYCVSMLRDTEQAVGALGLTLMIAAGRLAELTEPGRLRPWLYALVRDECRRRAASSRFDVPREAGGAGMNNAALFAAAVAGLSWDDREIVELCLRQRLVGQDLADALGIPGDQARALFAAARVRLQRALGAVFVALTGRADCAELARSLAGWDGRSSGPLIAAVRAHIGSCLTCQQRELRKLPTWQVLAERRPAREATLPPGVREDVLALLAEVAEVDAPPDDLIADLVKHRAGTLGAGGFPAGRAGRERRPPSVQVAAAAAGVVAAGAVIVMFAMPGGGSPAPAPARAILPSVTSHAARPAARAVSGFIAGILPPSPTWPVSAPASPPGG